MADKSGRGSELFVCVRPGRADRVRLAGVPVATDDVAWLGASPYLALSRADGRYVILRWDDQAERFTDGSGSSVASYLGAAAPTARWGGGFDFDPRTNRLAYFGFEDKHLHVWQARDNRDYAIARNSRAQGDMRRPSWSPDGRWVAFCATGRHRTHQWEDPFEDLWVVDWAGAAARRLGYGQSFAWVRGTRKIVAIEGPRAAGRILAQYCPTSRSRTVLRRVPEGRNMYSVASNPVGSRVAVFGAYGLPGKERDGLYVLDPRGRFVQLLVPQLDRGLHPNTVALAW